MRRLFLSALFMVIAGSCCIIAKWSPPSTPVSPIPAQLEIQPESVATHRPPTATISKPIKPNPTATDLEKEMRFIADNFAYGDCLMPAMQSIQQEIDRQAEGTGSVTGVVYAAEDLRDCHKLLPRNPPVLWRPTHQHLVRADTCLLQLADSLERFVITSNASDADHALNAMDCLSREYAAATADMPK